MPSLSVLISTYFLSAIIGFLIGFLGLIRKSILSFLPFAGTPVLFDGPHESHAYWNSVFLYILLFGLFIVCGGPSLFDGSYETGIPWHWQKLGLSILALATGEVARVKLFASLEEGPQPTPRTTLTADDLYDSIDARKRAEFLASDYARQFDSYEDFRVSLEP